MKVTIIPIDGAIYVDGKSHMDLDLSACNVPTNIHALQWKDTTGWVEFVDNTDGSKPENQTISSLPEWANSCVAVWQTEDTKLATLQAVLAGQPI